MGFATAAAIVGTATSLATTAKGAVDEATAEDPNAQLGAPNQNPMQQQAQQMPQPSFAMPQQQPQQPLQPLKDPFGGGLPGGGGWLV